MKLTSSTIIVVTCLFLGCGSSLSKGIDESVPRVTTSLGTIEGYYKFSRNGRLYEAYEGIPYAEPPIGRLRFEVARPVSPWSGVLMAKKFAPACIQYKPKQGNNSHNVEGSEDCLYLNIYTPLSSNYHRGVNRKEVNLFPVIVFIHGGAFQMGNVKKYKSDYLLDKDVILVTFHYRLGPFGFLSTEDEVVPGNMGLKDQVIALRWVKNTVESFGGDPSRITIFGQSAGGSCVHYHYLTNLTMGLFQRGMSMSGTALSCWAQFQNPMEKTKKLATVVECPTDDVRLMINCMKTRPAHQIVQTFGKFLLTSDTAIPFGPVVEKGGGEFTFIDRPPVEIINSGKVQDVPWITSVVSEEGLFLVSKLLTSNQSLVEFNDNWETVAPELLKFNNTVPKIDHPKVAKMIRRHYFGTSPIDRSTVNQVVKMVGDRMMGYTGEEAARLQAKANKSPVRFSYFSYRGAHSFTELLTGSRENFGVSHSDDLSYVFGALFDPTTTPRDKRMQEKLIDVWVSFASDGEPEVGVQWPNVSRSMGELDYLHIAGPDEIAVKTSPNFGETEFWHSVGFDENNDRAITERLEITSAALAGGKNLKTSGLSIICLCLVYTIYNI